MKKTYINPAMEVVVIKAQTLLAGSVTSAGFDSDFNNAKETSVADGRYDDFDWEDEE